MDQVILLLRNPRWAIPSYHNMRWELDYSRDWPSSALRIFDTYTERPTVDRWESWRDGRVNIEMNRWHNFVDFWMTGGFLEWKNETHHHCNDHVNNTAYKEIDCNPKAVVDFDHFYQENPTNEFFKITNVLDGSPNVEIIAAQARVCVLDKVYNRTDLHQANRPFPDRPPQYRFTAPQFTRILNRTIELINKFGSLEPLPFQLVEPTPATFATNAAELVRILESYNLDNVAEYLLELDIYLEEWVEAKYGTTDCGTLTDSVDSFICEFMKDKANHDRLTDGFYPDDFPFEDYLEVSYLKDLSLKKTLINEKIN